MPKSSYLASCLGKVAHRGKRQAINHIRSLRRKPGQADQQLEAYPCRYCGAWHVGHRPGQRSPGRGPGPSGGFRAVPDPRGPPRAS